jgi:hypothetical protein
MTGRPTLCTEAITERIAQLMRGGNTIHASCHASGIGVSTYHHWMERGEADEEAGKDPGYETGQSPYLDFRDRVTRSTAESEALLTKYVQSAAERDWRAAIALLERRFPERWSQKHEVVGKVEHGGTVTHQLELPEDAARIGEITEVMAEIAVVPHPANGNGSNGDHLLEAGDQ